jgi:hypothetical protein
MCFCEYKHALLRRIASERRSFYEGCSALKTEATGFSEIQIITHKCHNPGDIRVAGILPPNIALNIT